MFFGPVILTEESLRIRAGRVDTLAGPDNGDQTGVLGTDGEVIAWPYAIDADPSATCWAS